jgi:RimJ/RimL family protein N-acetyltransferase
VELKTNRLILRRARQSDLAEVNAFMAHPAAMQYWSTPPHKTIAQTRSWLQAMIDAPEAVSEDFLIEFEGRVIGEVGAFPLPEFGFILHPDYWRRGFGFEAAAAAIGHIFATRTIESLIADVDPRNGDSIALLEKLGFSKTDEKQRALCVAGEWVDSAYYRLNRPLAPQSQA